MQRRELLRCTTAALTGLAALGCEPATESAKPAAASTKLGSASPADPDADAVPDARQTAPLTVPAGGVIQVAFLISADAELVDFAGPWGVFEYVRVGEDQHNPFKLYTVAASKEPVRVSGGMSIMPEHTFADVPAPNVVVVPAMNTETLAPAALAWLRAVQAETDVTMSVCNGSFVLAKAGLLDGKSATAHHGGYGAMRVFPRVNVVRGVRFVEDGKIATAGGLTSGTDLAMRLVERYFGREVAEQTARQLEYQGTGWKHPHSNAVFVEQAVASAERPICPVCEMAVDRQEALTAEHREKTYYFCGEWCRRHFLATPERFFGS